MSNIFSYDSKLMQILDTLGNTIMLTSLFVLCCLPVITIGASFTALFAACRAQTRGMPCFRAFFKAFGTNFLRATLLWLLLGIPALACAWAAWVIYANDLATVPLVFAIIGSCLLTILLTTCLLFYSRFECTFRQLLQNGMVMMLSYPVRSLLIAILAWMPVLCLFLLHKVFFAMAIVWVGLYFGTAGSVCVWLMKKPFARLAETLLGVVETDPTDEPAHGH